MESTATPPVEPQTQSQGQKDAGPIKDKRYFFDDGDCMFVVEGFLFKLHKWALCRDPDSDSTFRGMFNNTIPLKSDTITLTDSADDFRALCWAVYALPGEIQWQNDAQTDISRLLSIAVLSHKYILPSFESWALYMICAHSKSRRDYLNTCPQDMLYGIFEAALAGGRPDLCKLVEEKWLPRLKRGELPLRDALDFGEKHGMREFLGNAYYQQAMDMNLFPPTPGTCGVIDFSQSNLTPQQLQRLLSGYCSLSLFWERLKKMSVPRTCAVTARYGANMHPSTVNQFLVRDLDEPLDVLKGLKATHAKVAQPSSSCSCGKDFVETLLSQFSKADYFLGKAV